MQIYITNFLDYLKIEKKYAKNTILAYKNDLQILQKNINLENINKDSVQKLIMQENKIGKSPASIKRLLSSISSFMDFLKHKNLTNIITPKLSKRLPKTLSYEQILLMMKPGNSLLQIRDSCIIAVLYSSALRVSELINIDKTDIDFNAGFIKILGKGNKQRYTPFGEVAKSKLKDYFTNRNDDNIAVFLNQRNTRIGVRAVQNIVKNKAIAAGIEFAVSPHMLRHSAATHLLQSSHDLRTTQEFLGHSSIKSTQVYTHLDFLELAKVYDKCHPHSKQK